MHRTPTLRPLAMAALGILLLAAASCSSDDGSSTSAPTSGGTATSTTTAARGSSSDAPDACSLLTADEVAQVLTQHSPDHRAYDAELTTDPAGENDCTVTWTSNGGGDEFTVSLFDASGYFADPSGPSPRDIDGIGDKAFEVDGNFYAQVGDQMIHIVNVQEGEGADEALLKIAAQRLRDS
jgi:hypothetical protein